jgi:hypothetical protein
MTHASRPASLAARCLLILSTAGTLTVATVGCSRDTAPPARAASPSISGTWLYKVGQPLRPAQADIPLTPWAAARMKAEKPSQGPNQDFRYTTDPALRYADPNGYPRISMHPMKFKLVQTDDYIYQLWEYNQNWRQIGMNKPHAQDAAPSWYGDAVAKWDGDTLVVDSIGYNGTTWLDSTGIPHTEDLHLVERIHRSGDTLVFDFTFDDPKAFTKPWSSQQTFTLVNDGAMTETIFTISDELLFRERFLHEPAPMPIRR